MRHLFVFERLIECFAYLSIVWNVMGKYLRFHIDNAFWSFLFTDGKNGRKIQREGQREREVTAE